MISYFGDFAEDDTVLIPFNTFSSDDPSASVTVTTLIASDIYVHKDGSVTDIVTDGATIAIDFDGITGNHLITIDTSASADYSTGSEYAVRIEGATVDAGNVNAWVGAFSIERANGALALLKLIQAATITNAAGADIAADIIAVKAETANIVADTNELQTDDVPGLIATLDAVVDTVKVDTAAILTDTATLGAPAGADHAADIAAIKAETALIVADTDVIDDGTSGLVKIATDVAAILVDTGTTLDTKLNDIQGTTFSSATDSLEALRDRGDSAWTGSTVTSDSGTAQAGAAGTITLQAGASAIDDTYNGQLIYISSGTGAGQSRAISDYTGSSKEADVVTNWGTTPDGTSVYAIYPDEITEITAAPSAAAVADAVWDENTTGHQSAGTFGQQVKDDIDAILVDTAEIGTAGAGLTSLATQASVDTIDTNVDAILVDTGTTLNDKIDTIDTNVDSILVDTGTTLDDHLTDIKGTSFVKDTHSLTDIEAYVDILDDATSGNAKIATDAAAILVDTGTTLDTAIGTVDTVVDAIKVVTDKFAFTVANQVDANVESINATTVIGVGTSGNKWRA